ncbi:hypothetical protein SAMN05216226_10367 [Halovenus aranensis]|uniref:PGF-CTERM protein n=1 Tax=Halovenus aranensis TaxID=890420 RepID=A0A1G8TGY2_9EURY|nr:hypothetical protein [Halovenus aranensis]SDJ40826.1 hypothetical protein SAMN05216226_10367 [Halovenus aranensis]
MTNKQQCREDTEDSSRTVAALVMLAFVVLLAGCTVTYEADIASDGSIDQLSVEIDMGEELYQSAQAQAQQEGYDSVGQYLFDGEGNNEIDESAWDSVEISDDGESTVGYTAEGGTADGLENVTITVDEEASEVTYVDTEGVETDTGSASADFGEVQWEYTVNMPGEVTDTNGNADGASVTWTSDEHENVTELRVTSEQTGDSDGSGPGFGLLTGLVGLAVVLGLGVARRTRR